MPDERGRITIKDIEEAMPRLAPPPLTRADVERIVDERMAPLANTLNRLADVIEKQSRVLEKLVPGSKGE